jgi:hypothetical protein
MDESMEKGGPVEHLGYAAALSSGLPLAALQSRTQNNPFPDSEKVRNLDESRADINQCEEHSGGCFLGRRRQRQGAESEDDQGHFEVA